MPDRWIENRWIDRVLADANKFKKLFLSRGVVPLLVQVSDATALFFRKGSIVIDSNTQ